MGQWPTGGSVRTYTVFFTYTVLYGHNLGCPKRITIVTLKLSIIDHHNMHNNNEKV